MIYIYIYIKYIYIYIKYIYIYNDLVWNPNPGIYGPSPYNFLRIQHAYPSPETLNSVVLEVVRLNMVKYIYIYICLDTSYYIEIPWIKQEHRSSSYPNRLCTPCYPHRMGPVSFRSMGIWEWSKSFRFSVSTMLNHTMWGPPVISWFISSSNYSYKYHKPYRFEILRHWKHRLDPFPSYKWLRSDPSTFILQHFLGDSTRSLPSNRQRGQRECFQGRWWSLEVSHGAQAKDIKI